MVLDVEARVNAGIAARREVGINSPLRKSGLGTDSICGRPIDLIEILFS